MFAGYYQTLSLFGFTLINLLWFGSGPEDVEINLDLKDFELSEILCDNSGFFPWKQMFEVLKAVNFTHEPSRIRLQILRTSVS